MHLPRGSARTGRVRARALASVAALAGLLVSTSWLAPGVVGPALDWATRDRSTSGVEPLAMRDVAWSLALPEGCSGSLRASALTLAPRRAGPFALNAARRPVLEDVELELRDANGIAWRVRSLHAAWQGSSLAMEGGCTVAGAAGIEEVQRVVWRRGTDRLEVDRNRGEHGQTSIARASAPPTERGPLPTRRDEQRPGNR